jgi:hypothetical protein
MAKSFRAVYKDQRGATFSAPVKKMPDGSWVMHSADGVQLPINPTFNDDQAGPLTFVEYREEPELADLRLHLPQKIGTESSFQQLQRAYVEQEVVGQRKQRQESRALAQQTVVNPAKGAQARDVNNQYAARLKRPRTNNQ